MKEVSPFRVVFIGDSHVLKFTSRLFDFGNCFFFSQATYLVGGKAAEILDANNRVIAPILAPLNSEKVINAQGAPWIDPNYFSLYSTIKHAEGRAAKPDPVVFYFGDIELRKIVKGTLNLTIDQVVDKYIRDAAGLKKAIGITLFIHALDPPTQNMDLFEKINGYRPDPVDLARTYSTFNSKLAERCAQYGLPVISTWSETFDQETGRGCRSEYEFDGVHLHPAKGAESTMRMIGRSILYSRGADSSSPAYIAFAQGVAAKPRMSITRLSPVSADICDKLNDPVSVGQIHDPAPTPHWGGAAPDTNFPKFNRHIRYGALSPSALEHLHKLLYETHYKEISDLIGNFIVVNSRYVESEPNPDEGVGPQKFHHDGNPAGIVRGLIYLCDVDADGGPFEWKLDKDSPDSHREVGPLGTFVLFDANQLFHRANPPKARGRKVIDLIFVRAKDGVRPLSVSKLGKTWPVDPRLIPISAGDAAIETTPTGIKHVGETMLYIN